MSVEKALAARRTLRWTPSDSQIAFMLAAFSIGVALIVRVLWPFDGLYGQDAYAYFRYAAALWPWLQRGEPLPIFYWPAGYPLLVALVLPFTGWSGAAGQIVSTLSGAVAGALTFLFTRELFPDLPGRRVGALVAGLTVVFAGAMLRANLVVMSDATAVACCAAAIWAIACYARSGTGGWLIGSAFALAWAIITRWVCGLLVLPLALYWLITCNPWTNIVTWRHASTHVVLAFTVGALVVVPQVLVSQTTPVALSEHQWLTGWSLANAWGRDFTTVDGTQHYELPVALFNLGQMARLGCLAPVGAVWLLLHRRWDALALLVAWPFTLFLFLSGIPFENTRFVLPALPALATLTGIGFGWLYAVLSRRWRIMLVVGLTLVLLVGLLLGTRDYRRLVDDKNDQLALVTWVGGRLPVDATLLTFGPTLTMQHYTNYDVRELYYLAPSDLARIVQQRNSVYLLLDIGGIERQWVGLRPEQDLRYLKQHPGLDVVGQRGVYTLFQLRGTDS